MNELTTRWQSSELLAFHKNLKQSLENGTFQGNSSPFGQIDGRWDFRGYDFSESRIIRNCCFEKINFSEANFPNARVRICSFRNITFEKTCFNDFSEHGCLFENCKFINSKLHHCILGYDGSKYICCIYEKCQFRRTSYIRAEFTQCKFLNNNLNGTEFGSSSLEDCVFTGKVKNVWFRGGYIVPEDEQSFGKAKPNPMTVSFEDAELADLVFSVGCDLSKVILPKKGIYYRFNRWEERLKHLASVVSGWPESEERKKVLQWVNAYMPQAEDQTWMILNEADCIKQMGEPTAKKYLELLSEA